MSEPIKDYAMIGDCHSAALISRRGSLDWLCLPRFDSPSIFGALLDDERGGRFAVRPIGPFHGEQRYLGDTAVLETRFTTESGKVRLVDAMPVAAEAEKHRALRPAHEVLRIVEGLEGDVELDIVCDPQPDYARARLRVRNRGALGLYYESGNQVLTVRSDLPLEPGPNPSAAVGRTRIRAGERHVVSLCVTHGEPAVLTTANGDAQTRLDQTMRWWEAWSARCRYAGPYRAAVVRSAITLKLMTFAPSGAVVAAPTTSLPEAPGGVRNWDYRYCWLRDASLTLQALFDLGYRPEAEAYLSWLLHTTRSIRLAPQVAYGVFGERRLPETDLTHLRGYDGARPVRIGNGAVTQLQLDNYGELTDAVYEFITRGGRLNRQTARLLTDLGRIVCRRWREPDEGIWEIRGGRRHHTHSKAMCWVALDRLIRLHDEAHLVAPVAWFRRERDAIRETIEARGYSETLRSYTATLDGDDVDASLLLLARYGYVSADAPRMRATYERVLDRLGSNALLFRYRSAPDGLPAGEGAFGACSFWAVETRARQGHTTAAAATFERLLSLGNAVGLFAEEIDPETGAALGNFPQAFTHVALIDAALMLAERAGTPGARHPAERRQATGGRV